MDRDKKFIASLQDSFSKVTLLFILWSGHSFLSRISKHTIMLNRYQDRDEPNYAKILRSCYIIAFLVNRAVDENEISNHEDIDDIKFIFKIVLDNFYKVADFELLQAEGGTKYNEIKKSIKRMKYFSKDK